MRLPFSHPSPKRFLSRSPDAPRPLSATLQALVPAGQEVCYPCTRDALAGKLLAEQVLPLVWNDSLLWQLIFCRAAATRQLNEAIAAGQLRLRQVVVPHASPHARNWLTRWLPLRWSQTRTHPSASPKNSMPAEGDIHA